MKWTIGKEPLLAALTKLQSVVEKKNTMEILGNTLFDTENNQLTLTGTNLEVGIQITLDAQIEQPGKLTLSNKNILDIVRELPNQNISFFRKPNQWVELSCGRSKFNLVSISADTYPSVPDFTSKEFVLANSNHFLEMITKTEFAISTDTTRFNMVGVYLENLESGLSRMVGTDGHRLSYIDTELFTKNSNLKRGIIIPPKGIQEIKKMLQGTKTISFCNEKGNIFLKTDEQYLFVRLVDAEYVPYKQVIPEGLSLSAKMKREDIFSALKRVSLMAHEKSKGVKFLFQEGLLTVSSSNADMGEAKDELSIDYQGNDLEIGFNGQYILQCLSVMDSEEVEFKLKDKMKAGILQASNQLNHTYVIMPMRI